MEGQMHAGKHRTCRQAKAPACAMLEGPLKMVLVTRVQSASAEAPPAYLRAPGTTVQPMRTPVKPADLLREHISMATSCAPAVGKNAISCRSRAGRRNKVQAFLLLQR